MWVSINQMPQCGWPEVFMEGTMSQTFDNVSSGSFPLIPLQITATGSGKQNQDNVPFVCQT